MKIKIEFFKDDFIESIGAGVYKIELQKDKNIKTLYIGESVYVLVRCGKHLFNLNNYPEYFGFTEETINDETITLKFSLIETCKNMRSRKQKEKQEIKTQNPLSQSGRSDYMKAKQDKIEAVNQFLQPS